MTLGAVAALISGRWPVALVVMAFMRVSDYAERFTGEQSRRALRDLLALAPQHALVEQDGIEVELPLPDVRPGDIVVVRPGARIPVDGAVVSGSASVDEATITGEAHAARRLLRRPGVGGDHGHRRDPVRENRTGRGGHHVRPGPSPRRGGGDPRLPVPAASRSGGDLVGSRNSITVV